MDQKVEVNFIASLGFLKLEYYKMGLFILKYLTLLSFHRVLNEKDSLTGKKMVTFISFGDKHF